MNCNYCGHKSTRHLEDGGCRATFCSCLTSKSIIENVEGLMNDKIQNELTSNEIREIAESVKILTLEEYILEKKGLDQ